MQFEVVSALSDCKNENTIYLIQDNWDDWFTYSTLFNVRYVDEKGKKHKIGGVKIGQRDQGRSPELPNKFKQLSEDFFSLGASEEYYEVIKNIFTEDQQREDIYFALKDIAFNLDLFERVKKLDVVQTSLMRDYTARVVTNQFHRMTLGGAWLTPYKFSYFPSGNVDVFDEDVTELEFEVDHNEMPPSNIHVLIGKNGVGKTTLLKNMIKSLKENEENYGKFQIWGDEGFSNIVYVSFSAFDDFLDTEDEVLQYSYIGLATKDGIKNIDMLAEDFADSLFEISSGNRKKLWTQTVDILESDNTFVELDIKRWSEGNSNNIKKIPLKYDIQSKGAIKKKFMKEDFVKKIVPRFKKLSSGHKIILLIIVRLIELVEEKTLVIMDEPEEHLHPPLVSAFIRALSNLLTYRNGVGIIATHSPVIVQEVPKECVWILRRMGDDIIAERPDIETFGENLGILTSEIFGYEVTNSGFHTMIQNAVEKYSEYEKALKYFNGQLGDEGKAILRSLMYVKEQSEEDADD